MSTPLRVALFVTALAVAFGAAWGFAANCIGPFYAVFMYQQLGLTVEAVSWLTILTSVGGVLSRKTVMMAIYLVLIGATGLAGQQFIAALKDHPVLAPPVEIPPDGWEPSRFVLVDNQFVPSPARRDQAISGWPNRTSMFSPTEKFE